MCEAFRIQNIILFFHKICLKTFSNQIILNINGWETRWVAEELI